MKKILLIALLAIGMLPRNGGATPGSISASGTFATGETVTISGTGFLTKNPAAPLLWAPFTSNINPSSLGRLTSWSGTGNSGCEVWESNIGSPGGGVRTNPASCINSSSSVMALWANFGPLGVQLNGLGAKFYLHRKRHPAERKIGDGSNIKSMLLEHFNAYGDGEVLYEESDSPQFKVQGMTPGAYFYTLNQVALNTWSTEEIVAQVASSINQNATLFSTFVNGVSNGSTTTGKEIGLNSGNIIDTVALAYHGHFSSTGAQDLEYFDDLYVDNTWSRVMIGNASTFAASTHRELLIPTAWSDTTITASFNQGTFTRGQTAYLYVFDSNGGVNPTGYAIEIEGEETPTPVDGVCGSANGGSFVAAPSANLCFAGTDGTVSCVGSSCSWPCNGINGGDSASCSASLTSGSISAWLTLTSDGSILTSGGDVLTPAQ